jgi:hypothetical protein
VFVFLLYCATKVFEPQQTHLASQGGWTPRSALFVAIPLYAEFQNFSSLSVACAPSSGLVALGCAAAARLPRNPTAQIDLVCTSSINLIPLPQNLLS